MMQTREDIVKAFTPVNGKFLTETQKIVLGKLEVEFRNLADLIALDVPACADRTAALRKLLECKMTCTQAVTHVGYEDVTKEKKHDTKEVKATHKTN